MLVTNAPATASAQDRSRPTSASQSLKPAKRVPQLDGIRGFAILAVVLTHLQQVLFPIALFGPGLSHGVGKSLDHVFQMGWMGVDIFFVLSGFLITGIILRETGQPSFYKGFYLRRAARILPVFLVVFAIVVAVIPRLPWHIYAAYLFFMANWLILIPFEVAALGMLWSLAIEEQFYLFWPPIVRNLRKETLLRVALLIAAASVLLRIVLAFAGVNVFTLYHMTPTRLDGLALGAALAVSLDLPGPRQFLHTQWRRISLAALAVWLGGFLSMKASFYPHHQRSLVLGSCTVEILTCMLIFGSLAGVLPPRLGATLVNAPLRWFGRRSYALYLIHSPLLTAAAYWRQQHYRVSLQTSVAACLFVAVVALLLTELSWRLIEAPAIRYGHRRTHASDETAVRALR